MGKEQLKKATLEALLDRKLQREQGSYGIKVINVPSLEMSVTAVKQPLSAVSDILDDLQTGKKMKFSETLDIYKQLIYLCVPLLHDEKLQAAYDCTEPYDVVTAVLEDNLGAITNLAEAILGMYGFQDIMDEIKNSSGQTKS